VSGAAPHERGARSIAASSGLLLAGRVAGNAGLFVAVLLLARGLGPSGRGTIAFLTVTAMVIAKVTDVGMTSAALVWAAQRLPLRPVLLTNLIGFTAMSSLAGGLLVFGGLIAVGDARPVDVDDVVLLAFVAGTVLVALGESGAAYLLGCTRFGVEAAVTAVVPWLYAVVLLVIDLGPGLDVAWAGYAWIGANGVRAALLVAAATSGIGFGRPDLRLLVESVRFGVQAWVGGLSRLLNFRLDQILMAYLATSAALGIYAVAVNVSEVLLYLPGAVATALVPYIAGAEPGHRVHHTLRVFRATGLLTLGTLAAAAVAGPILIPLVFGEPFRDSVVPFLLLLPGALGFTAMRVFSGALVASSFPGRSSLGPAVALVTGVLLDLVLIPPFGASGAAAAASAAFLVGGAVAAGVYRGSTQFSLRALVPGPTDAGDLWRVASDGLARMRGRISTT
jgi:O-antigen/teichoic acid export membrane protein